MTRIRLAAALAPVPWYALAFIAFCVTLLVFVLMPFSPADLLGLRSFHSFPMSLPDDFDPGPLSQGLTGIGRAIGGLYVFIAIWAAEAVLCAAGLRRVKPGAWRGIVLTLAATIAVGVYGEWVDSRLRFADPDGYWQSSSAQSWEVTLGGMLFYMIGAVGVWLMFGRRPLRARGDSANNASRSS